MATVADLLKKPKQPWEEGEGVVPDQPIAHIDPAALSASSAGAPSLEQAPVTSSELAFAQAAILQRRQEAIAKAAAPITSGLQQAPLPGTVAALIAALLGLKSGKEKQPQP